MKRFRVNNGVRSTLAAWMLLALSMSSVSLVHAHHGGGSSHRHGSDEFGLTCCGHAHPDDGEATLSPVGDHHHGFVTLLGGVVCLPGSGEPVVPGDHSPCAWCCWVATASAAQVDRPASDSRTLDSVGPPVLPAVSTIPFDGFLRSAALRADLPAASLLCDRARHERSGVLLA